VSHPLSSLITAVAASALVVGAPAEARFGKSSTASSSSSSQSSTSSSTRVSTGSTSSSSSSGEYHSAAPVGAGRSSASSGWGGRRSSGWSFFGPRPVSYGYYSGAFVPRYGYGYCVRNTPLVTGAVMTSGVVGEGAVTTEQSGLRVTAGIEGLMLTANQVGYVLGAGASAEGERWGLTLQGQAIVVRADDGTLETDRIGVLSARLTYAFLAGKYGRLRLEGGAETVVAPSMVALAPAVGLSGSLWIFGPVALEASAVVVPWPYRELDWRAGAVLGVGPVGIRAGWRTQVLDDQGLVDQVIHRDTFAGPYAGLSMAF
jgi:hypothetical protein